MNDTISLIATAGVVGVLAFLLYLLNSYRSIGQDEQQWRFIRQVVFAIEQMYGSESGAERKSRAIEWIAKRFPSIDETDLNRMIEAAVKMVNGLDFPDEE